MKQRNNKLNHTTNHNVKLKLTSLSTRELPPEMKNMNNCIRARSYR